MKRWSRSWSCLALSLLGALVAGACDGSTPSDAGMADVGPTAPDAGLVAAPAEPAAPALTPCPDGWDTRFVRPGVPECEPWTEAVGEEWCDPGELRVPGEGCVPIGADCPADGWPSDLPADAVHVSAAAAPGGDGTRDAPFATIAEALEAVGAEGTVALAVGEYEEAVVLDGAIELRGACPAQTDLTLATPASSPGDAVITVTGTGATLRDLSVRFAERAGVYVRAGGSLTVRGLGIYGVAGVGIGVTGELDGDRVLVDGVRSDLGASRGFNVEGDGRATLRQVVVDRTDEVAAFASGTLRLEDAALRGEVSDDLPGLPGFSRGVGVAAEAGGTLELVRGVVERHTGAGARVGPDGRLVLEDVVVRGNRDEALRMDGAGQATLRRVVLGPEHPWGVLMIGGAQLEAEDVVIRGAALRGMSVQLGARAELRRVLVADSAELGVMVHGDGAALVAEDLVIEDTRGSVVGQGSGRGLNVQRGATAEITRGRFARNREVGVFLGGAGPSSTLRDVTIVDTRGRLEDGRSGAGLAVLTDMRVDAERLRVDGSRGIGITVDAGELVLRAARVAGTRTHDCAPSTCPDAAGGTGMGAFRGGSLVARSFRVEGAPLCGVQVAQGAEMQLEDGVVTDGRIGACVQVEGYDISRLEEGVLYLANEVNLDSADQYVPESLLPVDPGGGD
ncbi:MAG TPA: right-handed parallel beta-helix repeat-containing protein [Sandaracinaceae bacterium LLY-WYZ-13_1]|nr:right-handed parallel beta-helix repeat-containing protein [Sandaracinaceae bacterium LLY-WYZ-13_1]